MVFRKDPNGSEASMAHIDGVPACNSVSPNIAYAVIITLCILVIITVVIMLARYIIAVKGDVLSYWLSKDDGTLYKISDGPDGKIHVTGKNSDGVGTLTWIGHLNVIMSDGAQMSGKLISGKRGILWTVTQPAAASTGGPDKKIMWVKQGL